MNKKKLIENTKSYHQELVAALADPVEAAAYLQVALDEYEEDGDPEAFLLALRNVTEAHGGITKLSQETHLNRQNLYRILSTTGNPRLLTLGVILKALGLRLSIEPIAA